MTTFASSLANGPFTCLCFSCAVCTSSLSCLSCLTVAAGGLRFSALLTSPAACFARPLDSLDLARRYSAVYRPFAYASLISASASSILLFAARQRPRTTVRS